MKGNRSHIDRCRTSKKKHEKYNDTSIIQGSNQQTHTQSKKKRKKNEQEPKSTLNDKQEKRVDLCEQEIERKSKGKRKREESRNVRGNTDRRQYNCNR